ncbi:MAG: hypothetical protein GY790_23745 [Bacteroidetes bacterium]|nr:hypothetical protein [Bacteroidota bacterium]
MKKISPPHTRNLFLLMFLLQTSLFAFAQDTVPPHYRRAAWTGESVALENQHLKLRMYRRVDGWAWGELHNADGKYMGIIEHLGELLLRDQDIPLRCVADSCETFFDERGQGLLFKVRSVVAREVLENTSFHDWMRYPLTEPPLIGEVRIILDKHEPRIHMEYRFRATGNYFARYIRGPWVKAGEQGFGMDKTDAILPGVDWAIGGEWTSGTDWFKDPWAKRYVPHPHKVTMPLMALSQDGTFVSLSWDPSQVATRWFNYRPHRPQPVFASPNFIDRMNNHLMGLMVPDASIEGHENEVYAEIPLELKIGQQVNFDAVLSLGRGQGMDALVDWVRINGLPSPGDPRWPYEETLDRIAGAYNTNLWHEGEGFGIYQRSQVARPNIPGFIERYISENQGEDLAESLRKKVEWSRQQLGAEASPREKKKQLIRQAEALLKEQREDGSFVFDPEGRHWKKDDFMVATNFIESMGPAGDSALEISIGPAMRLLDIGKSTGEKKYLEAARLAFESCMHMERPEAGDYWETPIHAANLLAAGNAAMAYYEAYLQFNEEAYREKAVYWIRCLLAFTHFWEPEGMPMLYNTKPVLSSSDWYFANWVRDHVQWEVLRVFVESAARGIDWADIDGEIDWDRYREGITMAAIRWMIDHREESWRPHNIPATWEPYTRGDYDHCYPDTHNCTSGQYGGMFILPDPIAMLIFAIVDKKNQ